MQEDDGYLFTLAEEEEENKDEELTLSYDFSNNTTQYRVKALVDEMNEGLISVPDLQRGPEVWNVARQSRRHKKANIIL